MCAVSPVSASSPRASTRTKLAAQALLAAIAERGADAVGYAHRTPGRRRRRSSSSARPPSELLDRVEVPAGREPAAGSTSATTPRGTRRSPPTTIPCGTGRSSGFTTGSSSTTTLLLDEPRLRAPRGDMTVDSEAIWALAAHTRQRRAGRSKCCTARWPPRGWTSASPQAAARRPWNGPAALARQRARAGVVVRLDEARAGAGRALLRPEAPQARAARRHRRGRWRNGETRLASASGLNEFVEQLRRAGRARAAGARGLPLRGSRPSPRPSKPPATRRSGRRRRRR